MIIRTSQLQDTVAIVDLLKLSLGEGLVKKSDIVWNFKHIDNPFGNSHVLLAIENDMLVGVRAFMKWNWQLGKEKWIAYRAVDTSTHPDYQGRGIFKRLTLQALQDVQKNEQTFVFNTPNNISRPGYLKMGWVVVDSLPISIIPTIGYFLNAFFLNKIKLNNKIESHRLDQICDIHNAVLEEKNVIFTPKSTKYLKWRFEQNQMQEYFVTSSNNWYIAMYIKKHSFFKELRVAEIIGENDSLSKKQIRKAIIKYAFTNNCWVITTASKDLFRLRLHGKFGPKLTFKSLTNNTSFINKALNINSWKYSLGDLELF